MTNFGQKIDTTFASGINHLSNAAKKANSFCAKHRKTIEKVTFVAILALAVIKAPLLILGTVATFTLIAKMPGKTGVAVRDLLKKVQSNAFVEHFVQPIGSVFSTPYRVYHIARDILAPLCAKLFKPAPAAPKRA